jgi:hypothetical protein
VLNRILIELPGNTHHLARRDDPIPKGISEHQYGMLSRYSVAPAAIPSIASEFKAKIEAPDLGHEGLG